MTEKRTDNKKPFAKKNFGEKKNFGDKKPFGDKKKFGDKKPFSKPAGDRKFGKPAPKKPENISILMLFI